MNDSESPAPQKGLSGLAIAGIGCGAVLLIAVIGGVLAFGFLARKVEDAGGDFQKNPAKAAAMLAVKANPELELVNTNDETGEITVRNKQGGEEVTMSFGELSQGRFRMKNSKGEEVSVEASGGPDGAGMVVKGPDGETTIGGTSAGASPPAWVPAYPGATSQSGGMKMEKKDSVAGAFTAQTADPTPKVKEFFEATLKADGFKLEEAPANSDGNDAAVVSGQQDESGRTITVLINAEKGTTSLVINYEGPK